MRRARQQEQLKRKEAEREAAMGFNPKPSKFMDLDKLQHQGMEDTERERKQSKSGERICMYALKLNKLGEGLHDDAV